MDVSPCECCGRDAVSRYCSVCYRPLNPTDSFARKIVNAGGACRELIAKIKGDKLFLRYLDAVGKERGFPPREKFEDKNVYAKKIGLKAPEITFRRKYDNDEGDAR